MTEQRAQVKKCETCKFYSSQKDSAMGICQRYPPAAATHQHAQRYPKVHPIFDGCGEHSPFREVLGG